MGLGEFDRLWTFSLNLLVDLVWSGPGETVDALGEVSSVGCFSVADAVDDPQLLWCEVLELVDDDSAEMVAIELGDLVIGKYEFGQAQEVIVSQTLFREALTFDLKRMRVPAFF